MDFQPTTEQQAAIDLFAGGEDLAMKAGAGTGKSTALKAIAHEHRDRRGQYTAFNRSIVQSMLGKMPPSVAVNTVHKLAWSAVGYKFAGRKAERRPSKENAKALGINDPIYVPIVGGGSRRLAPGYLASYVLRGLTEFCKSDSAEPDLRNFPYINGLDLPDEKTGRRSCANNNAVRAAMLPALVRAWADAQKPDGVLPYYPDRFLKLWERSGPTIGAEFLMVDECQDMSPVMLSVIKQQRGVQTVLVGDSAQAINSFMGARNAFEHIHTEHTALLTRSFRFGPEIADFANTILDRLDADLRLEGRPGAVGYIGPCQRPDVILTRTNAEAVAEVLRVQKMGLRAHLVGHTGKNVVAFARAAMELRERGFTPHPELAIFTTWSQVQDYVEHDALGGELALLVKLVDDFGAETIISALGNLPAPSAADLTVSTAHQSKGLEWDTVTLASDFPGPDKLDMESAPEAVDELRLLYVAVTRAKTALDVTSCPSFEKAPAGV